MPIEALAAFARKKATKDELLRALCTWDKWFVPIEVATEAMSGKTFESLSVWGSQSKVPPSQLWVFTDPEAGTRAAKVKPLGPYASPLAGAALFRHLPERYSEVHVNPHSPPERSWFFGGDWVELARRWGAAVMLEKLISGKVKRELTQELIDYDAFSTFKLSKDLIATAPGVGGLNNPGMVFTANDCCDASLKAAGAAGKKWKRVTGNGRQLFTAYSKFAKHGIDGLVLNPHGPGPLKVIDEPHCWGIITAIAARDTQP